MPLAGFEPAIPASERPQTRLRPLGYWGRRHVFTYFRQFAEEYGSSGNTFDLFSGCVLFESGLEDELSLVFLLFSSVTPRKF